MRGRNEQWEGHVLSGAGKHLECRINARKYLVTLGISALGHASATFEDRRQRIRSTLHTRKLIAASTRRPLLLQVKSKPIRSPRFKLKRLRGSWRVFHKRGFLSLYVLQIASSLLTIVSTILFLVQEFSKYFCFQSFSIILQVFSSSLFVHRRLTLFEHLSTIFRNPSTIIFHSPYPGKRTTPVATVL